MKSLFYFLLALVLSLVEPLLTVIWPRLVVVMPPIVFWFFLWIYWSKEDDRYFYVLALVIGLVLDVIQQTILGFHPLNLLISIGLGVWIVQALVDKNNIKYPGTVFVAWLLYFGGEYVYELVAIGY